MHPCRDLLQNLGGLSPFLSKRSGLQRVAKGYT
jgi:hypothetical protein